MIENSIPPIDRDEWKKIIEQSEEYNFSGYHFQISVHTLRMQYKLKMLTLDQAIDELRTLSKQYYEQSINDLKLIFKEW